MNDAGYVYVHSESSIWSQQVKCHDDLVFVPAIYIAILIPKWKYVFHSASNHLNAILNVIRLVQYGHKLKKDNLHWVERFDSYLFHAFNRELSFSDKVHLFLLAFYIRILKRIGPTVKFPYNVLSSLI